VDEAEQVVLLPEPPDQLGSQVPLPPFFLIAPTRFIRSIPLSMVAERSAGAVHGTEGEQERLPIGHTTGTAPTVMHRRIRFLRLLQPRLLFRRCCRRFRRPHQEAENVGGEVRPPILWGEEEVVQFEERGGRSLGDLSSSSSPPSPSSCTSPRGSSRRVEERERRWYVRNRLCALRTSDRAAGCSQLLAGRGRRGWFRAIAVAVVVAANAALRRRLRRCRPLALPPLLLLVVVQHQEPPYQQVALLARDERQIAVTTTGSFVKVYSRCIVVSFSSPSSSSLKLVEMSPLAIPEVSLGGHEEGVIVVVWRRSRRGIRRIRERKNRSDPLKVGTTKLR